MVEVSRGASDDSTVVVEVSFEKRNFVFLINCEKAPVVSPTSLNDEVSILSNFVDRDNTHTKPMTRVKIAAPQKA